MNEAAEIKKHLKRSRELREDALAEPALDAVSDSVIEAVLRSAVSRLEILKMHEVSYRRLQSQVLNIWRRRHGR